MKTWCDEAGRQRWRGLLLGALLLAGPTPLLAADRHAAIVIDANTGGLLHADKVDEARFPASLTKMMTLYMAFEAIDKGRLTYTTRIKVSEEAASAPPTKLGLDAGQSIALIDAMKALITKSANDMTIAVAEHLAGTEERFAQAMTQKARLIGMPRTTFRNASGLPDSEQVTTARDMATLALRLHDDFPQHYQLFALKTFSYSGGTHRNHNNLLFNFTGTDGIKTGYTRASGYNLVASVRRGNRHVIGAVFGGSTASRRDDAMRLLVSRALVKASPDRVRKPAPTLVAAATPAARPQPAVRAAPETAPEPRQQAAAPTIAIARVRQVPVEPPQRLAQLPPVVPPLAPAPAAPAISRQHPLPARGAPPSTLQQQAENIARGTAATNDVAPPPTPVLTRVAQASSTAPARLQGPTAVGGYEVQIGAFGSEAEAERALSAARAAAATALAQKPVRLLPMQKDARQLIRARFAGFDAKAASDTCLELRRRQIDCFVARAE